MVGLIRRIGFTELESKVHDDYEHKQWQECQHGRDKKQLRMQYNQIPHYSSTDHVHNSILQRVREIDEGGQEENQNSSDEVTHPCLQSPGVYQRDILHMLIGLPRPGSAELGYQLSRSEVGHALRQFLGQEKEIGCIELPVVRFLLAYFPVALHPHLPSVIVDDICYLFSQLGDVFHDEGRHNDMQD